jgi:regulator of replication initiation timing
MKINEKVLIGILSGLLIISVAFITWQSNSNRTIIREKEIQYVEIKESKDTLEKEHSETLSKLEEAEIKIDGLTNTNIQSDKEIKSLKSKIKNILYKEKVTVKELETAKVLISELNVKITDYLKENDVLKQNNSKLTEENTSLQMDKNQLVQVLDSTRVEKSKADDVIDLGSTLVISNIGIQGLNVKGKKTDVAEKIHKLKFSFVINENRISSSGKKTIYFVLVNPFGKEVSIDGVSEVLSAKQHGQKLFTGKKELDYSQGLIQKAEFDVEMSKVFVDGLYKVQIYENGMLVGESRLALKKKKVLGFL